MTWLHRYRLKWILRRSLWLFPVLAIGVALVAASLVRWIDRISNRDWFGLEPEGARLILGAFTSSTLTFVIFVVSSLLIVVQLASAQLTPRIIAMVLADRRLKWVLTAFTFTYTYTIAIAGRIDDASPQLAVASAIACNLTCIAILFWFVQWLGESLRPISVLQAVAQAGREVVERVYPSQFVPDGEQPSPSLLQGSDASVVEHTGASGVVLAFSQFNLVEIAQRTDTVIELVPQVGEFVAHGDPLFRVQNSGRPIDVTELRANVAIGAERTMEQDPRFAFRILLDIGNKALSSAINDPTTAVLALDQVHKLLMHVGKRRLDNGQVTDGQRRLRLIYETPNWNDFVILGVTEIRHYGASSIQVARRLHAMLVHLLQVLPEARKPALQDELNLLQRAIQRSYLDDEDEARAQVGDFQGIGSSESS
jgi:uncharacterized membrane protein